MTSRVGALDSLRGIAATAVLIDHCLPLLGDTNDNFQAIRERIGHLLGKDAVLVFFVLSGFVLFLSIRGTARFQYLPYAVKRVTRIYPPFAVAILLSALLMVLVRPEYIEGMHYYSTFLWNEYPTPRVIFMHLAMTDNAKWQTLDIAMWSLVHEIRISLIFPLLAFGIMARWQMTVLVSLAISAVSVAFYKYFGETIVFNPLSTLRYLWLFAVGAAMAMHHAPIRDWMHSRGGAFRLGLWGVTLVMLFFPLERTENLTTSIGSVLIVLLCIGDKAFSRWLDGPIPEWLGRISYSLYLIHFPILLTTSHLLFGKMPSPVLTVMTMALSLAAAHVMYHLVERPSIAFGRSLSKRLSGGQAKEGDSIGSRA